MKMGNLKNKKPIAVLISDIHYNINTLPVADAALRQAIAKANQLNVSLIVAGDTHDTKANLRAECTNALIETFKQCNTTAYVLVGNHDKINEKSEEHALNFLDKYAVIINRFRDPKSHCNVIASNWILCCYHHDADELRRQLRHNTTRNIIMHQGITGSKSGDYIQDKSALSPADLAGRRVISGHYHTRQTIDLPDGGKFDYIGNPYTLNFAEANDPPKGFQVLYDDGSLEFVPTNLRKHVVIEMDGIKDIPYNYAPGDLIKVKLTARKEDLAVYTKERIAKMLNIDWGFRLDIIPLETSTETQETRKETSKPEILDSLIDSTHNTSAEQKERIKKLWRNL